MEFIKFEKFMIIKESWRYEKDIYRYKRGIKNTIIKYKNKT